MKRYCLAGMLLLAGCLAGCINIQVNADIDEEVALAEVPPEILAAAREAVTGITFTEAEMEVERGQTVYELQGIADGKEYEIEVTAAGKVLKVEEEDEDD